MATFGVILFGSVALVAAAFITIPILAENWDKAGRYRLIRHFAFVSVALGMAGLCVIWRYGYSLVPERDVGVRWDGFRYSPLSESSMCWRHECLVFAESTTLEGAVQPITDNPKVRHLRYKVEVRIVDSVLFARSLRLEPGDTCPGVGPMRCQLENAVMYEVFEFNNANSRELANFYNPYDPNQTGELQKLLLQKLNPPLLAKGINFKRLVSWSVE